MTRIIDPPNYYPSSNDITISTPVVGYVRVEDEGEDLWAPLLCVGLGSVVVCWPAERP